MTTLPSEVSTSSSNPRDATEIITSDEESDQEYKENNEPSKPTPKRLKKFDTTSGKKKPAKTGKIEGLTLEQHRRALGDLVHGKIRCEKYTISAITFVTAKMSLHVFRELVLPHATKIVPENFDAETAVVVALLSGSEACGNVFGKSKIKGGNRMQQWSANRADVIFFPAEGNVRIHWTMR